jgi:hypothetical protein
LRVCGSNPGGEGPWSNVEKTVILPATPAWIEAKRTESGHVTVNWGAVPGKLAYRLQMIADEGTIEVYRGEETHIDGTIKGAAGAVAFRVRAEAPGDVHSGWQLGEPLAPSGPRGPQISEPELGMLGEIHLRWNAVAGPDRYRLEVSQTRDFTGLLHAQESKDPETVFYPPAGGVYWFRVRMLNAEDLPGAPGEPVRLVVREAAAPRLFEVHTPQANHPLELAWSGMPGTDAYEIQESMRDSFPEDRTETLTRVRHPSQKITLPPRPPVTVYYRVRAISGSGKPGPWSNVIRVELQ